MQRYRILAPDEPLPEGAPRRYRKGEGYVQLRWKVGKDQYVWCYEHRLVQGLPVGREVHHKNRIRDDNDPENLVPLTSRQHGAEHRRISRDAVVSLYRTGLSTVAVGKQLGTDSSRVWRILAEEGEPIRPAGVSRRTKVDEDEVLRLYRSGLGGDAVAERMGIGRSIVWRVLRSHPEEVRPCGRPRVSR